MSGRLRHYVCGSTAHDLSAMYRDVPREVRTFPSGVFLYDAPDGRRVLFDTGYRTGRWDSGWRGALYRWLLPPRADAADDVAARLRNDEIDPASVTHVVLSHLHPDHVGGVHRFPDATFVLTAGTLRTLEHPRLRTGVLAGLLPDWFPDARRTVLDRTAFRDRRVRGVTLRTTDLLGDGTYLVVDLPGHADGHIGALVEESVLLAGDAAWGRDLLDRTSELRRLPLAVQHDAEQYRRTARTLQQLADDGIRVVCSHDPVGETELLD